MAAFPFQIFSCCDTLYAILDKAPAITLSLTLICLLSRLYSCKVKLHLTSLWFLFFRPMEEKHCVYGGTQIYIKMLQCQKESKALLFNSGVICLVLVKHLGEVWNRVIYPIFSNLHENSTTPYVTGIYGQLELFLKVWCYQNWFTQYGFDFVETVFGFLWQNISDILCQKNCYWTGHIRKILTKLTIISSHT